MGLQTPSADGLSPRETLRLLAERTRELVDRHARLLPRRRPAGAGRPRASTSCAGTTSTTRSAPRLGRVLRGEGLPGAHPAGRRPGAPVPLHLRAVAEPRRAGARRRRRRRSASRGSRCPTTCRGSSSSRTDAARGRVPAARGPDRRAPVDAVPGHGGRRAPRVPGHPQRRLRGRGGPRRGPAAGPRTRAGAAPVRPGRAPRGRRRHRRARSLELLVSEIEVEPDDVLRVPGPARPRPRCGRCTTSTGRR